jgi:hypothetical protein
VGSRVGTNTDKNLVGPTAEMDMEIMIEISAIFPFPDPPANSLVTTRTELPGVRKAIASSVLSHIMSVHKERHGPKRTKYVEFQSWDFYRQGPTHASLVNNDALCAMPNLFFLGHLKHSVPQTTPHGMLG